MMTWILKLLCRGFVSQRGVVELGDMDRIAGSNMSGLLLAQEQARLNYLRTIEAFCRKTTARHLAHLLESIVRLQSTNALVQSLINQHLLETMISNQPEQRLTISRGNVRKSA